MREHDMADRHRVAFAGAPENALWRHVIRGHGPSRGAPAASEPDAGPARPRLGSRMSWEYAAKGKLARAGDRQRRGLRGGAGLTTTRRGGSFRVVEPSKRHQAPRCPPLGLWRAVGSAMPPPKRRRPPRGRPMWAWTKLVPLVLMSTAACAPSGVGSSSGGSSSPATQALGTLGSRLGLTSPEIAYTPWAEPNALDNTGEAHLAQARIEEMSANDWRLALARIEKKQEEIDIKRQEINEACNKQSLFEGNCLEKYQKQLEDMNRDTSNLTYYKMEIRHRSRQKAEREVRAAENARLRAEEARKPRTVRKVNLLSVAQTQELIAHCPVMAYEIIALQGVEGGPGPRDQAAKALSHALYGVGPLTELATIMDLGEKYEECGRESLYHAGRPFRPSWKVVETTVIPPEVEPSPEVVAPPKALIPSEIEPADENATPPGTEPVEEEEIIFEEAQP